MFHVAQLVWLAGLVVPAAIRSALLPVFGRVRDNPAAHRREFHHATDMCFGLLPYGLFGGYLVVHVLAPIAFLPLTSMAPTALPRSTSSPSCWQDGASRCWPRRLTPV